MLKMLFTMPALNNKIMSKARRTMGDTKIIDDHYSSNMVINSISRIYVSAISVSLATRYSHLC